MDKALRNKDYQDYVSKKIPKTPMFKSLLLAFIIGGLICLLGQFIADFLKYLFPAMYQTQINTWMLIIIIFTTILLTGIGVWDEVGYLAGAGAFVPITGFANAISSPAIEFKKEGIIFGLCVKMFVVAGPIIVSGVVMSVIAGLLYLIL